MESSYLMTSTGPLILLTLFLFRTQDDYEIKGTWLSEDKSRQIEIYEDDGKYYGKDQTSHIMLKDLVYDESDRSYSGKLVSPDGAELSATVIFLDEDTIEITGRKLLIKRSYTFSRVKKG